MGCSESAVQAVVLAARTILECGGETYRAEETALRMCRSFGMPDAEIMAFPTGFTLAVRKPNGATETRVMRILHRRINLRFINDVNSISRRVVAGELTPDQALDELTALRAHPEAPVLRQVALFALAAGAFSVMFGGGVIEFLISCVVGGIMQACMPLYTKARLPLLLVSLASGILAAGLSLPLLHVFGGSQESVISGVIMPLLPGLAMTNAVRDTMRGDLLSGMARATEALVSVMMLAAGVAVVLML
ncbi:MAG: threonine/serine exporter family protein [Christensenellales bacterium]|jgi:uncharacterized membrane protein YjjP (DUF1212 family)